MTISISIAGSPDGLEAVGREVVQQLRAFERKRMVTGDDVMRLNRDVRDQPENARHRAWEQQWEQLTRIPWREWVRRMQPRRLRVLLAEHTHDTRIWLDDREIHGLVRAVSVDAEVGEMGRLTITIPLALVELL